MLKSIRLFQGDEKLFSNRKKVVLSILFGLALFGFYLAAALPEGMIPGHVAKAAVLCGVCTGFLMIPELENWAKMLLSLVYLAYVPYKMFLRMELPIQNLQNTISRAILVSCVMIVLVWLFFYLITQRVHFAFGLGSVFLLLYTIANYYVYHFRGSVLGPFDFAAADTAFSVAGNYSYAISQEMAYTVVYFAAFICWGFRMKLQLPSLPARLIVSAAALTALLGAFYLFVHTDFLRDHGIHGDDYTIVDINEKNGSMLYMIIEYRRARMDEPAGYSERALLEIGDEAQRIYEQRKSDEGTGERTKAANVIFVMCEAFSDLRVLGDYTTNEEVTPFLDSLAYAENAQVGNCYVSILGGLTANSEFEALTGNSLFFLSPSCIPYLTMIKHDTYSMVDFLKQQSYSALALHPYAAGSFRRNEIYPLFGFEEFVDLNQFMTETESVRIYCSDSSDYRELIARYEQRDRDRNFFCFNVTMQNHSAYYGDLDMPIYITSIGENTGYELKDWYSENTYLNLMKHSDDALRELIEYFSKVEEPTIICLFGDHQPILSDAFYDTVYAGEELTSSERMQRKHIVPYVLWTNYDAGLEDYGDMSANYLGAVVAEAAGCELSSYQKFLLNLKEELPVISTQIVLDKDGRELSMDQAAERDDVKQYEKLQYRVLFGGDEAKELFDIRYQPENRTKDNP